jgi:pyruvate,water dikinase
MLNVVGADDLLVAVRRCFASLFTDRAISYRESKGFDHREIALSVGVQVMVRSDLGAAGVAFTLDTETGFRDVVTIDAAWGLGESVVGGTVNPDDYQVFKPLLGDDDLAPIIVRDRGAKEIKVVYGPEGRSTETVETDEAEQVGWVLADDEILRLARWCVRIEDHYGHPMDIEWAKDGRTGELFIVQARPETVRSREAGDALRTYRLTESGGEPLVDGLAIGSAIAAGPVQVLESAEEVSRFEPGSVVVTTMTDPDWVPIMERAAAIVTDRGGRTSHAAIVSRELGIPAVVGTGDATERLAEGAVVTVSCAEGDTGRVYDGELGFESTDVDLSTLPATDTAIMMILASPAAAFRWWRLPVDGIGLARMEFIVNNAIQAHPMALLHPERVEDDDERRRIEALVTGYPDGAGFFVDRLARGIGRIAASQYPDRVIVRMSDFKSNEYAGLVGGRWFEIDEANPMLGLRGAARYTSPRYAEAFALECRAIEVVRKEMGFVNVTPMIPFCRTLDEADRVLASMAEHGLRRGDDGLEVYVMCEVPSNVILAEAFADRFDGFSIGSNDLTQLILGVDRDEQELAVLFDERDEAVVTAIRDVIARAHEVGIVIGICGQAPSDHPEFADILVSAGIDSISVTPDSVASVLDRVAELEAARA